MYAGAPHSTLSDLERGTARPLTTYGASDAVPSHTRTVTSSQRESRAAMLEMIYEGTQENKRLVQALVDQDLIESVTFDITLNDGTRNSLLGFHTINEEKLADLSAETLHLFNRNDMLTPIFMIIASTNKMHGLIDRKNTRLNI